MERIKSFVYLAFSGVAILLCSAPVAFGAGAPCTWLTQAEVTTAFGVTAAAGVPINDTGCSWRVPKMMLTVSMQSEKLYTGASHGAKKPASGVGDEAFFTGTDGFMSLWVKKGSSYLLIRLYGFPASDAQPKLTTIGKSVASKF